MWFYNKKHLVDYVEDVKKDAKSVNGDHLCHHVVFFASSNDFYFGCGLGAVYHGVQRVHSPPLWVI